MKCRRNTATFSTLRRFLARFTCMQGHVSAASDKDACARRDDACAVTPNPAPGPLAAFEASGANRIALSG
jgi:hypothetical protein